MILLFGSGDRAARRPDDSTYGDGHHTHRPPRVTSLNSIPTGQSDPSLPKRQLRGRGVSSVRWKNPKNHVAFSKRTEEETNSAQPILICQNLSLISLTNSSSLARLDRCMKLDDEIACQPVVVSPLVPIHSELDTPGDEWMENDYDTSPSA